MSDKPQWIGESGLRIRLMCLTKYSSSVIPSVLDMADIIADCYAKSDEAKELERLRRWSNLAIDAAEAGADGEVLSRFAESEKIKPIIDAWKDKVAVQQAEIERLRKIVDAAWLMRTEEKDYTVSPDLVLRAQWRERLYKLLDGCKENGTRAAEAARKGTT